MKSKIKGGVIPLETWRASRANEVPRKVVLSTLKQEFISLLFRHGGYLEPCYEELAQKWGHTVNHTRRTVNSWRLRDLVFNQTVKEITKETSFALMETALETHKKRIAYGDKELMVQNGKPVLTPKGMAMKAKMEAEGAEEWQVLGYLSDRHNESEDVYVVRVSYPENLVRQTLANAEAETFKGDYTPSKMSNEQLQAMLSQVLGSALPSKTEPTEIIEAEVTEED